MNGKRYILDTNAIISLLKGNLELLKILEYADWIGISIISKIEFRAFRGLSDADAMLFAAFLHRVDVIDLANRNESLLQNTINIRKQYKIKLPDAIVISTAISNHSTLITADKQLRLVKEVDILSFESF
ncbi:MAG: PIN domain-containing protein [Candidatus Aminicenantes bacterium]|nr:PIN domain-containing protein [Candidatus Aminicenantes bacterium]